MANNRIDYLFNIVLVGSQSTGKSCFLSRYVTNIIKENYEPTIGIAFNVKYIVSSNTASRIKLTIWDTAGDEKFKGVTTAYYRGAHGFFVLFDVTDRESFNKVPSILKDIEDLSTCATNPIKIILIANKIDLADKRQVSSEEAKELADQLGIPYIEASAKNNINIAESFTKIALDIEASQKDPPPRRADPVPNTNSWNLRCNIL